ncbi:uncharacterized protein LOC135091195 [Scylla paramamosain]|uniref:uncharacterized protein LOC135091195 n=1 Tax=Scylla paramamosain TaxID=85552 RepID=UPI003083EA6E
MLLPPSVSSIEKNKCVWDTREENYSKSNMKREVFKKLTEALKQYLNMGPVTPDIVRPKLKSLRQYFFREMLKTRNTPSGSSGKTSGKWELFDSLNFLAVIVVNVHNPS